MSRFKTRFGCRFCRTVHGVEYTLGQHHDAFLEEYRSPARPPSNSQIPFHPTSILRAVRSSIPRETIRPVPADADILDECSEWCLTVPLYSSAEVRAHERLDRTELTAQWWTEFAKSGLSPGDVSDPRTTAGYTEWKARQRIEAQDEAQRRQRLEAQNERRQRLEALKATERLQRITNEETERRHLLDAQKQTDRTRLRAAVVDKGKKRAILIDTPSPPLPPSSSCSSSSSSDSDTDVPDAALHHTHTHAADALCVNYSSIASQGSIALGMGTVVTTPRGKPGRAPTTPIDAAPLIVLRLRIADTGAVVPVCGVDTLAGVLETVKTAVSAEVRDAAVGLEGAGEQKEWVKMREGWSAVWDEDRWAVLKRRAGRCVRVPLVDVGIVWAFEA